jgi:acetyl-CoA carboxylase biotin carboxyl carrier protein
VSGPSAESGDDHGSVLDALCRSALMLLDSASQAPARLRLESNGTRVEIEWPASIPGCAVAHLPPPAAAAPAAEPMPVPVPVAEQTAGTGLADGSGAGPAGQAPGPGEFWVRSPMVGTFYRAPEPGAASFVRPGDAVKAGQQVGIVEVMKLMTPVVADRPGHVVAILADDGTPVEHGQPLITCAVPGDR